MAADPTVANRDTAAAQWQADHHMHLASGDICQRVGECLDSNQPAAVYAADLVQALDRSGVSRGVAISSAYLYGLPSLGLDAASIAAWTRRENEFTAKEAGKYPDRLTGFLSVDPLQPSALAEIRFWQDQPALVGVKLHFSAAEVNLQDPDHRTKLAAVLEQAATRTMPLIIHIGGGDFAGEDARTFIQSLLPRAGASQIQIAHAGGGLPLQADFHLQVLRAFADHMSQRDILTERIFFDVSYVPAPEQGLDIIAALLYEMRRIGLNHFLFGSDFNVLMPEQQFEALQRLGLSAMEWQALRGNCAPWVCR